MADEKEIRVTGSIPRPVRLRGRRKLVVGTLATLAAVVAILVPAATAHAATNQPGAVPSSVSQPGVTLLSSPADCAALPDDNGRPLCFWVDIDWTGTMGYYYGTGPHWYLWTTNASQCPNGNWANCASGLYNDSTTNYAVVWDVDGLHGAHRCLAPGTQLKNLVLDYFNGGTVNMNDAIESNSWSSTSC